MLLQPKIERVGHCLGEAVQWVIPSSQDAFILHIPLRGHLSTEATKVYWSPEGKERRVKCYFVPMKDVNNIQQQAFWDQPSSNVDLLRVLRVVGYMLDYADDNIGKGT